MAYIPFLNNAYFSAKVGIGTDSPDYKLDVNSSAFVGARIESTSSGYAPASILLESGHADSRGQGIYQYNSVSKNSWFSGVPYSTTSDDWVIAHKLETTAFNSDVAQMSNALFCVNDNGKVGIGTTSPGAKLEVQGTNTAGDLALSNSSTTVSSGDILGKLAFRNYDGSINFSPFSGEVASIRAVAAVNFTGTNGANTDLLFYTNSVSPANGSPVSGGSEKMRISSAGAIKFNAYGAGTLVTDASGNITVSSGGGAGGPYLPLSAGSTKPLTGDLYIPGFIYHVGDTNTFFGFNSSDQWKVTAGGNVGIQLQNTSVYLYYGGNEKLRTASTGVTVTGDIQIDSALLSNQENTDVDIATETVANVLIADYTAAFYDFVIKKGTNVRSGTVYACHDGTNVEYTETSTNDLGDTSDVTLSVAISGTNMKLLATATSADWSVKSLIRAI